MTILLSSNAFAESDIKNHWAEKTIGRLVDEGYIKGYEDGSLKPDNKITRAEFMAAANSIFGFNEKADISFADVEKTDWFYDTVRIAAGAGYISGYDDNTIRAENYITKQEAAFIVSVISGYEPDSSYADTFADGALTDGWAKGAVGALAKNGIISGYEDGTFRGRNNITRAEAFTVLSNALDKILDKKTAAQEAAESADYDKNGEAAEGADLPTEAAKPYFADEDEAFEVSDIQQWKSVLLAAVNRLEPEVTVKISGFDKNAYDLSKLNFSEANIKPSGEIYNGVATVKYTFEYKDNFKILTAVKNPSVLSKLSDRDKATIEFLKQEVGRITNDNMTDFEKELAVHDYIVGNYSYAKDNDTQNDEYYNINDFIINKVGYCEAYAYTFAVMAELSGVEAAVMVGKSNNTSHAWNAVKLDGEYYYVDVTFDDGAENDNIILHTYFNLNDSEMADTHSWTKEENNGVTAMGTKYNYFRYKNILFEDMESLQSYITGEVEKNTENVEFAIKGFILSRNDIKDTLSRFSDKVSGFGIVGDIDGDGAFQLIITYR